MDQTSQTVSVPESIQRLATEIFTVLAAVLYALILGTAIVQSLLGQEATLTDGAIKAARMLGGLVGAVVSAGFAGSWRASTTPLSTQHAIGGLTTSSWASLRPTSRRRSKLTSLARALGFLPRLTSHVRAAPGGGEEPGEPESPGVALGMALLYVIVYFAVGIAAFALVLIKADVPELVESSAWTWLGSVMASVYTYFGMDVQVSMN